MRHIYSLAQQAPRQTYTGQRPPDGADAPFFAFLAGQRRPCSADELAAASPLHTLFLFLFVRSAGARGLRSRGAVCGRNSRGGAGAAVCFLRGRSDARSKNRAPQPGGGRDGFLALCRSTLYHSISFPFLFAALGPEGEGGGFDSPSLGPGCRYPNFQRGPLPA